MSSDTAYFPDALAGSEQLRSPEAGALQPKGLDTEPSRQTATPVLRLVDVSDENLMKQLRAGEQEALSQLFRRHARTVRHIALRILRDEAEADDLVQEVFLFLFQRAALYNPEKGPALTWILHVAYHRAFDRRRYLNSRKFYASQEIDEQIERYANPLGELPSQSQSWDGILGRKLADRFRSRLTPEQQETLQLFFFEGYALKEIAELTGRSLIKVRSHYYRGLERLRQFVLPHMKRLK